MTVDVDQGVIKTIIEWAWTVLFVPLKVLWSKADGAASKHELREAIRLIEDGNRTWRETTNQLFANAESDRMQWHGNFSKMQDKIHDAENRSRDAHAALMTQVNAAATAANSASASAAAILSMKR